jgi:hypothetical protein
MTRQSTSDTALAVDPPQMDLDRTSAADAPLIDLRGSTVCLPGPRARLAGGWSWPSWVTRSIDLHEQERDCGMRNTWIAVAAAVGVGILNGGQVWFYRNESTFGSRVAVHALVALVLTPLVVGVYLALPDLARRLLRRLRDDGVIQVHSDAELDAAAPELGWFNHRWLVLPAAALAGLYLVYVSVLAAEQKSAQPPMSVVAVALVVQAVLMFVAVVAIGRLFILSRAVGKLLRGLPVHIQPLHPDHCGGLWIVGRMFSLMLNVAAVLGGVALCIGVALDGLQQPGLMPTRRLELYLLAVLYAGLLPTAFLNLLWLPHKLMEHRRSVLLKPVARVFDTAIEAARPDPADNAARLKAKADSLAEITRQLRTLDDAVPVWPLRMKRLGPVVVTAVLPVVVPLVTAVLTKLLNP